MSRNRDIKSEREISGRQKIERERKIGVSKRVRRGGEGIFRENKIIIFGQVIKEIIEVVRKG